VVFGGFDPLDKTQYQPILQKFHLLIIAIPAVYITYAGVCSSSRETAWTKKCDEEVKKEKHEFLGVLTSF